MKKRKSLNAKVENEKAMTEMRRVSSIRSVRVRSVNDKWVCDECKKLADQEFPIEGAPELPYSKCTAEAGCRCYYQPVVSVDAVLEEIDEILKD